MDVTKVLRISLTSLTCYYHSIDVHLNSPMVLSSNNSRSCKRGFRPKPITELLRYRFGVAHLGRCKDGRPQVSDDHRSLPRLNHISSEILALRLEKAEQLCITTPMKFPATLVALVMFHTIDRISSELVGLAIFECVANRQ